MIERGNMCMSLGSDRAIRSRDAGEERTSSIVVEVCNLHAEETCVFDGTVLYAARGSACTLTTMGETFLLGSHDVCLLQSGVKHSVVCDGMSPIRVVMQKDILHGHFLPIASGCPLFLEFLVQGLNRHSAMPYLLFSYRGRSDVSADIERLYLEYCKQAAGYETVLLCTLVNMMVSLSRDYWLQARLTDIPSGDKLAFLLKYISDHSAEVTLESTAAEFNCHPNTISTLLKRELGTTFSDLVRQYRLERAAALLATTEMPIDHVAELCGYEHMGNFYRVFKAQYGVTPGVYARRERGQLLGKIEGSMQADGYLRLEQAVQVLGTHLASIKPASAGTPEDELWRTHIPNFRDLGGKWTKDGSFVRRGLVYRSGGLCEIAELGPDALHERGIRAIYDLRQDGECLSQPALATAGVPVHRLLPPDVIAWKPVKGLRAGLISSCGRPGEHMAANYAAAALTYREAFSAVLLAMAAGGMPMLFCCRNGRDRAGILAAVILRTLGVPSDAIMEDYVRSNYELQERNDMDFLRLSDGMNPDELAVLRSFFEAREEYLEAFWRGIDEGFGSFERYLEHGLGVSSIERESIKRQLLM